MMYVNTALVIMCTANLDFTTYGPLHLRSRTVCVGGNAMYGNGNGVVCARPPPPCRPPPGGVLADTPAPAYSTARPDPKRTAPSGKHTKAMPLQESRRPVPVLYTHVRGGVPTALPHCTGFLSRIQRRWQCSMSLRRSCAISMRHVAVCITNCVNCRAPDLGIVHF